MSDPPGRAARRVLHALADLAPTEEQRRVAKVIPLEWFRWLPVSAASFFGPSAATNDTVSVEVDNDLGERLAAIDQVRLGSRVLRVGFLFVAGRASGTGAGRRVFHPLLTVPVRVGRGGIGGARLRPSGEPMLSELIDDPDRSRLEAMIEYGAGALDTLRDIAAPTELLARLDRLGRFAADAAVAAGFDVGASMAAATTDPNGLMERDGLVVVAGAGVFIADDTAAPSRASALRAWTDESLTTRTALHALYFPDDMVDDSAGEPAAVAADRAVIAAQALTPRQHQIVVTSRTDDVTVVSGAPGTGKSHTIAAIAFDAVARGQTVLVAAKSEATVDALVDLLERVAGPAPVVFGSNERRDALAARLASGTLRPAADADVAAAADRVRAAVGECHALFDSVQADLQLEVDRNAPESDLATARALFPQLFADHVDLDAVDHLVARITGPSGSWAARRRRRRARAQLAGITGRSDAPIDQVSRAVDLARARRDVSAEGVPAGLDADPRWQALDDAFAVARDATGRWLELEVRSDERLRRRNLAAVAALGTALRSGRAARRARLATLADEHLTEALPLWIGTLADIDDLLPAQPALFDLAILDEASSIDQGLAAPALLRGTRAVVVGDPRQLRHVSFLSDEQIERVVVAHGLEADPLLAARLDARRNSIFDIAVGAAPANILDEHWRCDPHLIDFVARHLYAREFSVATRTPASQLVDCVQTVRVDGDRDDEGVVTAEVDAIVAALRHERSAGATSVGIVSPFRAQADALEAAVLAAFTADDLIAMDVRVGTVHQFQGNERDVIYCSLGIGSNAAATSWRFVEDPHLLSVFLTRARRRLVFVYSADPPANGLIHRYLADADSPPGPAPGGGALAVWATEAIDDLAAAGVEVSRSFPAGRHVVDAAAMVAGRPVAIFFGVHSEGAALHIDRRLSLQRSGWTVIDVHESTWRGRHGELVVDLLRVLRDDGLPPIRAADSLM